MSNGNYFEVQWSFFSCRRKSNNCVYTHIFQHLLWRDFTLKQWKFSNKNGNGMSQNSLIICICSSKRQWTVTKNWILVWILMPILWRSIHEPDCWEKNIIFINRDYAHPLIKFCKVVKSCFSSICNPSFDLKSSGLRSLVLTVTAHSTSFYAKVNLPLLPTWQEYMVYGLTLEFLSSYQNNGWFSEKWSLIRDKTEAYFSI